MSTSTHRPSIQALAQVGMYVPAEEASISIADGIFTHFPLEEKADQSTGRLGEEAVRLNEIAEQISEQSLVLLNESLSSTSFGESLYIAGDFVKALSVLGCRVVFATHLHELADQIDEINDSVAGRSRLKSIVALAEEIPSGKKRGDGQAKRLYKIVRAPPRGRSYEMEIARKHHISFEQVMEKFRNRGVIG